MGFERLGVADELGAQIGMEEARHVSGLLQVAGCAQLGELSHIRLEGAESVPLDQDSGEVASREAHHGVVAAIGEQLSLYSFHRGPVSVSVSFRAVHEGSGRDRSQYRLCR